MDNPFQAWADDLAERTAELVVKKFKELQGAEIEDRLYTREMTAKHFSVSLVTVDRWLSTGVLKHKKMGSRIYIRYGDILEAGSSLKKYKRARV